MWLVKLYIIKGGGGPTNKTVVKLLSKSADKESFWRFTFKCGLFLPLRWTHSWSGHAGDRCRPGCTAGGPIVQARWAEGSWAPPPPSHACPRVHPHPAGGVLVASPVPSGRRTNRLPRREESRKLWSPNSWCHGLCHQLSVRHMWNLETPTTTTTTSLKMSDFYFNLESLR